MPDALSPRDVPRDVPGAVRPEDLRDDLRDDLRADLHEDLRDDLRAVDLAATVVVALGARAATAAGDHRALVRLVARLAGVDAASVALTQICPNCGLPGHGPLRVQLEDPSLATVQVSLARSGDRLALAVTSAGAVGIDLESVADIARVPLNDVLLSPAETDALARLGKRESEAALADLWTAKEAVLKAAGVGLRVDPRELTIARDRTAGSAGQTPVDAANADADADNRRLVDWPHAAFPLSELHLLPVAAPPGTVGTVAVVCARRPALRILPPDSEPLHSR